MLRLQGNDSLHEPTRVLLIIWVQKFAVDWPRGVCAQMGNGENREPSTERRSDEYSGGLSQVFISTPPEINDRLLLLMDFRYILNHDILQISLFYVDISLLLVS